MLAMKPMLKRMQKGFSLVTAIFLLVVLAVLGVGMAVFSAAQHSSLAMDLMGSRAYQAARAGVEWGAFQILRNPTGAFVTGCQAGPASEAIPAGTLAGQLSPFAVQLSCSSTVQSDVMPATADTTGAVGNVWVYALSSVAATGTLGQQDYVERQIAVTIAQ